MYGCTAKIKGASMPARKSTRFMPSSPFMAARLNRTCDGSHDHVALHGKALSEAAFYPVQLRIAILRGMRDQADHEYRLMSEEDDVVNLESLRA